MENNFDIIVIGAGHAGLSISYLLAQSGINHIVLEKNRIGESWRSCRWDTFKMVTPNKTNLLPGQKAVNNPDNFATANEFVQNLVDYASGNNLPVKENCPVLSLGREGDFFKVTIADHHQPTYFARQVVVASGSQSLPDIPAFAKSLSPAVFQIHSSSYRNSAQLPLGNILVVGSGQSGIQIAEELLQKGKKVFLSTSRVGRVPRRYCDKDIIAWFIETGIYDEYASQTDLSGNKTPQPQLSANEYGYDLNYKSILKLGGQLIGKVAGGKQTSLQVLDNGIDNVLYADEYWRNLRDRIDQHIQGLKPDVNKEEDSKQYADQSISQDTQFDLHTNGISTIIWATGFKQDFSFINLPIKKDGVIQQIGGVTEIPGLYFLGVPWMRKRKSGIIWGIEEDATYILELLLNSPLPFKSEKKVQR